MNTYGRNTLIRHMIFLIYQVAQKWAKLTRLNQTFVCNVHITDIILLVVVLLATTLLRVVLEVSLRVSHQQIKFCYQFFVPPYI
jgi:hypothetical protein